MGLQRGGHALEKPSFKADSAQTAWLTQPNPCLVLGAANAGEGLILAGNCRTMAKHLMEANPEELDNAPDQSPNTHDPPLPEAAFGAGSDAARILENISDAFYALDNNWRFTYVNAQAERLLSRTRADLLGRNLWEEFPAAVGTPFESEGRRALAEQTPVVVEGCYPPPLGLWFEVRAFPSREGLSVFFQDITARKGREEALKQSEERYRLLKVRLAPGDALAIFTDGLTEVGPSRRDMLGIEGVAALLAQSSKEGNNAAEQAEIIALRLVAGVDAASLGGVARDDMCVLVGVVNGQEA